jgi:hypothetical protein
VTVRKKGEIEIPCYVLEDGIREVTNLIAQPAGIKLSKNKELLNKSALQPATPPQYILDLGIEVQRDVNGVEMGVLENGIRWIRLLRPSVPFCTRPFNHTGWRP